MVAVDNKCLVLGAFAVMMYFMWMDITLWYHLQALAPSEKGTLPKPSGFSVFYRISVKLLMCDPINHYIYLPICFIFTQVTHFSQLFGFITPNMISVARVLVIVPGLRLLLSESLGVRQAGVAIILVGEWMDALDGFVARLRTANHVMQSEVGALGFYMDGFCDGVSAIMLMLVCLFYLKRHPPRQTGHSALELPVICSKVETRLQESKEALLGSSAWPRQTVPYRAVVTTVVLFGFQLLVASIGWNHVIADYQQLLENGDGSHTVKQLAVMKAASTWILMWFWRFACFHSLTHCLLVAIFFDKLWASSGGRPPSNTVLTSSWPDELLLPPVIHRTPEVLWWPPSHTVLTSNWPDELRRPSAPQPTPGVLWWLPAVARPVTPSSPPAGPTSCCGGVSHLDH